MALFCEENPTLTLVSDPYAHRAKGLQAMTHDEDPKEKILRQIGDISKIEVGPCKLLVATYIRPEKTAGGIILTAKTLAEDEYQGKVGLVLKLGPLCFENSDSHNFGGFKVAVGDWVMYRVSDGFMVKLTGQDKGEHCRVIEDAMIQAKLPHPDAVL